MNQFKKMYYSSTPLRVASFFMSPRSYKSSNFKVLIEDLFPTPYEEKERDVHLCKAMSWLYHAYSQGKPGVAGSYYMNLGWTGPYPETTGYIIPTFLNYSTYVQQHGMQKEVNTNKYTTAAMDMANWLVDIQLENGGFPAGTLETDSREPNVFNTGQIIIGLVTALEYTQDKTYLNAAERAGDWLVSVQNTNGTWTKFTYEHDARSYHSRISWPLLLLHATLPKESYRTAARKNLDWIVTNQLANSWFKKANFYDEKTTLMHTLAYTLRGLLETGILLNETRYINAVKDTAYKLLRIYEIRKYDLLPALFDETWKATVDYSCLTGCAQMSIIWSKLFNITGDIRFFNAALKINTALKKNQSLHIKSQDMHGGIKGSYPIQGAYMPFSFPNWAAKFFVDALLLEQTILEKLTKEIIGESL